MIVTGPEREAAHYRCRRQKVCTLCVKQVKHNFFITKFIQVPKTCKSRETPHRHLSAHTAHPDKMMKCCFKAAVWLVVLIHSATSQTGGTICSRYPKICDGTWTCADSTLTSCSFHVPNLQMSGTIPTELGLLADIFRADDSESILSLYGNRLSGTIPTELNNFPATCNLVESQAPAHWVCGEFGCTPRIENPNTWACPIEVTGACALEGWNNRLSVDKPYGRVGERPGGVQCSYYLPPSPPGPPEQPSPPGAPSPPTEPPPAFPPSTTDMIVIGASSAAAILLVLAAVLLYRWRAFKNKPKPSFQVGQRPGGSTGGSTDTELARPRMPGKLPGEATNSGLSASPKAATVAPHTC